MKLPECLRIMRFGIVGLTAAAAHYCVVVAVVELFGIAPLLANVAGFVFAFWVSYFGHRNWTFSDSIDKQAGKKDTFLRFLSVAVLGFFMNEFLFFLLLQYTAMPYYVALALVVLSVAAMTYILSRLWAFRRIAAQ